jgi:aspartyl-tRNA synthetase
VRATIDLEEYLALKSECERLQATLDDAKRSCEIYDTTHKTMSGEIRRVEAERELLRAAMLEAYWIINFPTESQEHHDRRKNWLHEHADEYLATSQREALK